MNVRVLLPSTVAPLPVMYFTLVPLVVAMMSNTPELATLLDVEMLPASDNASVPALMVVSPV